MSDRTLLRVGVGVAIVLFVLLPVGSGDGALWPVTLALAAAIGTIGLVGAIVLWRSPPMPPEPPDGPDQPSPPEGS